MGREEEERLGSRVSGFSNSHGVWLYYERCSGSKMPTPNGRASETHWSLLRYELQRLLFCLQVYSFKGYWAKLSSNLEYIKYTKPHLHYHNSVVRREWHNLVSEEVSTQLALETERGQHKAGSCWLCSFLSPGCAASWQPNGQPGQLLLSVLWGRSWSEASEGARSTSVREAQEHVSDAVRFLEQLKVYLEKCSCSSVCAKGWGRKNQ